MNDTQTAPEKTADGDPLEDRGTADSALDSVTEPDEENDDDQEDDGDEEESNEDDQP